jgi:hypothetical protein
MGAVRHGARLIFLSITQQKSLRIGFAVGIILFGRRIAFGQNGQLRPMVESTLCIRVYNTADVSSGVLDYASKEAATILLAAGIPTLWYRAFPDSLAAQTSHLSSSSVVPRVKPVDEPDCLVLCVVRGMPRGAFPAALGSAFPHAQSGPDVTIFYDRIERLERRAISAGATGSQILAYAMAHEIGHVLLDSTDHSPAGIMKGPWGQTEFERLTKGWLKFTDRQSEVMRQGAFRRAASKPRKKQDSCVQ